MADPNLAAIGYALTRQRATVPAMDGPQEGIVVTADTSGVQFTVPAYSPDFKFGPAPYQEPQPGAVPPPGTRCLVTFVGGGLDKPYVTNFFGWTPDPPATQGGTPLVNALGSLRTTKLHLNKVENVAVQPNSEQTLLDQTGPGTVVSLWMALGADGTSLDGRLRVYYDGASTPAIDIDYGTLLATHWGAGAASGSHSCTHVHAEINSANYNTGFLITFPLPFGSRIRIAHYNPNTLRGWIYSMATYELTAADQANGQRLRCAGARFKDQVVTRQPGDVITLASTSGGPGTVVYHSQVGGVDAKVITPSPSDGNSDSWMERNFAFYIDGETDPSIQATGTEDWYDSAWYFNGWKDYNTSFHSYVGTDKPSNQPNCVGMATDLWSKWGGVPFTKSMTMKALTEPVCTTGDRLCWCVLYYSAS